MCACVPGCDFVMSKSLLRQQEVRRYLLHLPSYLARPYLAVTWDFAKKVRRGLGDLG